MYVSVCTYKYRNNLWTWWRCQQLFNNRNKNCQNFKKTLASCTVTENTKIYTNYIYQINTTRILLKYNYNCRLHARRNDLTASKIHNKNQKKKNKKNPTHFPPLLTIHTHVHTHTQPIYSILLNFIILSWSEKSKRKEKKESRNIQFNFILTII